MCSGKGVDANQCLVAEMLLQKNKDLLLQCSLSEVQGPGKFKTLQATWSIEVGRQPDERPVTCDLCDL